MSRETTARGEKRSAEAAGAETQHLIRKRKARRQRDERGNDNSYKRHYPPPSQRSHRHRAAQRASARQQLRKDDGRSLRKFYTKILQSTNTLFIVRRPNEATGASTWTVVQVDLDDTDPVRAQKLGEYSYKLYIQHQQDSETKPLFQCRYWPEIRGVRNETSKGRLNLVSPDKVTAYMRRHNARRQSVFWVDDTICISEHRLAGPFDWATQESGKTRKSGSNHVPSEAWAELEEGASGRGMEVQSVRQVSPIVL